MPFELSSNMASLLVLLTIAVPVGTSLLLGILLAFFKPGERWERPVGMVAMVSMTVSLLLVIAMAGLWLAGGMKTLELTLPWKIFSIWNIFLYDRTSALLSIVAAMMGLATLRFSGTYLHREPGFTRFMAVALAFIGSIMGAIFADNPVQMAAWWEFIGASSLLLIGFYHDRPGPCSGAIAVLRQYRIADAGMLVGCGLILANEVHGEYGAAALLPPEVRDVAALGFTLAVLVKSAQLPFSGWLPRAMEGPTPSSALFYGGLSLHVGLLLAARLHALWETSPLAKWLFNGWIHGGHDRVWFLGMGCSSHCRACCYPLVPVDSCPIATDGCCLVSTVHGFVTWTCGRNAFCSSCLDFRAQVIPSAFRNGGQDTSVWTSLVPRCFSAKCAKLFQYTSPGCCLGICSQPFGSPDRFCRGTCVVPCCSCSGNGSFPCFGKPPTVVWCHRGLRASHDRSLDGC